MGNLKPYDRTYSKSIKAHRKKHKEFHLLKNVGCQKQ